jgi:hypothetical protein
VWLTRHKVQYSAFVATVMNLLVLYSTKIYIYIYICSYDWTHFHFSSVAATSFYKVLSGEGIPISVFLPAQTVATPLLLKTGYYRLAVIVDVACDGGVQFMAEVSFPYDVPFRSVKYSFFHETIFTCCKHCVHLCMMKIEMEDLRLVSTCM